MIVIDTLVRVLRLVFVAFRGCLEICLLFLIRICRVFGVEGF